MDGCPWRWHWVPGVGSVCTVLAETETVRKEAASPTELPRCLLSRALLEQCSLSRKLVVSMTLPYDTCCTQHRRYTCDAQTFSKCLLTE